MRRIKRTRGVGEEKEVLRKDTVRTYVRYFRVFKTSPKVR